MVVKDPNGAYVTDGRENQWCKVKPEYADEMGETIDCLVIGGWNYSPFLDELVADVGLHQVAGGELESEVGRYHLCFVVFEMSTIGILILTDQR